MSRKKVIISVIVVVILLGVTYGVAYTHGLRTAGNVDRILAEMLAINPEASDHRLVQGAVIANIVKNIDDPDLNEIYEELMTDFLRYIEENWVSKESQPNG